jgi:hypothetical protein
MAGKSEDKASGARPSRRGKKSNEPAAPQPVQPAQPESGAAKRLLQAGIKALGEVPADVMARQGKIFEVLLGIGQSPGWPAARRPGEEDAADPFGKFEHVFDERVARSLARLGMPTPQALAELSDRVERLTEALNKLEAARRKR